MQNLTRAALAAAAILTVAGCSHLPIPGLTAASTTGVTDGPYALIQEPQAGYSTISSRIDGAKKSVRVVIYELAFFGGFSVLHSSRVVSVGIAQAAPLIGC